MLATHVPLRGRAEPGFVTRVAHVDAATASINVDVEVPEDNPTHVSLTIGNLEVLGTTTTGCQFVLPYRRSLASLIACLQRAAELAEQSRMLDGLPEEYPT
jgi:hypothetical protein